MTVAARQRDLDAVHDGLTRWVRAQHPHAAEHLRRPLHRVVRVVDVLDEIAVRLLGVVEDRFAAIADGELLLRSRR